MTLSAADLRAEVDELEAERRTLEARAVMLGERIDLLDQLLDTFDDVPVVPTKAPAKAAKRPAKKLPRVGRKYPCPEAGCEFVAGAPQGLGAHRRAKHGTAGSGKRARAKKAAEAAASRQERAAAVAAAAPVAGKVFRCHDCDGTADPVEAETLADLTHHAITVHERSLFTGERIPVTPDAARAA